MPDYKEMYLTLFRATEQAINLLIKAQRKSEEAYLQDENTPILSICPVAESAEDSLTNNSDKTVDKSRKTC